MPEAAMHEYGQLVLRQKEIGPTLQIPAMEAEAEAFSMKQLAHEKLRLRVATSDARHVGTTSFWTQSISHRHDIPNSPPIQ